jgi:flagellar hook-length control protein FliK
MAAIDAISKGTIGSGQAAGKANAGPASGFDLLFDVSSGAPAEGGRPAFVDGLVLPSSGQPEIGPSEMKSLDVVAPLSEAELDAEWSFATVVSAPEVSDDLKTDTQVLGCMMPQPVQEDVFLATPPMSSSTPLISDDDEKDLASFEEADASLALAVFAAVITPSMAPPDPEAESNSKHQLLDVVASGQPLSTQGELGQTSDPAKVLEHSGLVLQDQPNTKDAPPLSLSSEAQLLSKGEEGKISDPGLVSEPAKAALKVKPKPEDGSPNAIIQSGSPQSYVGRTTTVATSAQMQAAGDIRDDSGDVTKSESQPATATTTVARLRINPAMTLPAEPLAATELAVAATREYPAQLRESTEAASIAPEKFDQLQSGSKAQTVLATLGPNLATMLPERTNELSLPNSTAPMMAQLRQTLDTRDASWREQLVTQVLGSARDGAQSISITLRPKSLGDIQLNIEINTSETTVRIITETASSARLLLANEDMLSHLMDQAGVRLTSMTTQHMTMTGWNGLASGQSTAQNSGGQSGRDGAGGRKERVRGAEPARADSAPILKLGDSSQLSINLMA